MKRVVWCGLALMVLIPSRSEASLIEANLTNTNQLIGGPQSLGVNLIYSSQPGVTAPGTVNGIPFTDINWLGGSQSLGGGVSVMPVPPDGSNRSRFQNTAGTIAGTDAAVLQSVANTINFVPFDAMLPGNESAHLIFSGLLANREYTVQLIGGDEGGFLGNWNGTFAVTSNGNAVGTWNAANDGDSTQATLATFTALTNALGVLDIGLTQNNPAQTQFNGPHAGLGGALVTLNPEATGVPEPTSVLLLGLGAFAMRTSLRRRARGS